MAKSKKYSSTADGTITVALGDGRGSLRLGPGDSYETEDPIEQTALDANSDIASGAKAPAKKKAKDDK